MKNILYPFSFRAVKSTGKPLIFLYQPKRRSNSSTGLNHDKTCHFITRTPQTTHTHTHAYKAPSNFNAKLLKTSFVKNTYPQNLDKSWKDIYVYSKILTLAEQYNGPNGAIYGWHFRSEVYLCKQICQEYTHTHILFSKWQQAYNDHCIK